MYLMVENPATILGLPPEVAVIIFAISIVVIIAAVNRFRPRTPIQIEQHARLRAEEEDIPEWVLFEICKKAEYKHVVYGRTSVNVYFVHDSLKESVVGQVQNGSLHSVWWQHRPESGKRPRGGSRTQPEATPQKDPDFMHKWENSTRKPKPKYKKKR